jgi:hypothetical protein
MQSGDYGLIESSTLEKYRLNCSHLWPQANIFQINPISTFDQSQSPPSYSSISSPPPPPYSSCDSQTDGGGGAVSINQN